MSDSKQGPELSNKPSLYSLNQIWCRPERGPTPRHCHCYASLKSANTKCVCEQHVCFSKRFRASRQLLLDKITIVHVDGQITGLLTWISCIKVTINNVGKNVNMECECRNIWCSLVYQQWFWIFIQHNCNKMIDSSLIYLGQGLRHTKDPHIPCPAAVSGPKTLLGRAEIGVTIRQGGWAAIFFFLYNFLEW